MVIKKYVKFDGPGEHKNIVKKNDSHISTASTLMNFQQSRHLTILIYNFILENSVHIWNLLIPPPNSVSVILNSILVLFRVFQTSILASNFMLRSNWPSTSILSNWSIEYAIRLCCLYYRSLVVWLVLRWYRLINSFRSQRKRCSIF